MRYLRMVLALAFMFMTSVGAYAGNKYSDQYTTEDGSGKWTFTAVSDMSTVVTATPSTLTSATSGETYLIAPPAATIVTMTLPDAVSGISYTFSVGGALKADPSVLVIAPSATDHILYGVSATGTSLRSTVSTGATISVHGGSGVWYVSGINGTWTVE